MKLKTTLFALLIATISWAQALEPTETEALLNINVKNESGTPGVGDEITLTGKTSGKSFSGKTNEEGKFSLLVPKGETYTVKYKSFGDDDEYTDLEIPNADGYINFDFTIVYELPKVYTLDNVYFDTGKATLKPSSYKALNNLAEVMKNKPALKIEVAGHTDNDGSEESNLKLSQARAESVKAYVSKQGVEAERMIAKGYGESKPIATNDTVVGKQKNRRTEVRILAQ
ncbi:MAG: OmpA family protein [Flavobacteriales bacterium]|nr:OmpA family protein [Flavobacteriales bacterium]